MKVKNWIIVALVGALTLSLVAVVAAQDSTANVEVRVWQSTQDAESLYISARSEGGSWQTLGTIPLDMSGLNRRETYRYGDITVAVPLGMASPRIDDSPDCQWIAALEERVDDFHVDYCEVGEALYEGYPIDGTILIGAEQWYLGGIVYGAGRYFTLRQPDSPVCREFQRWSQDRYESAYVQRCDVTLTVDEPFTFAGEEKRPLEIYYRIDSLMQLDPVSYHRFIGRMDLDLNMYELYSPGLGTTLEIEGGDPVIAE